MARFGQMQVNVTYDAGTEFEYISERIFNVYEIDDGTHTVAFFNEVAEGSSGSAVYLDVDLDSAEEIAAIFFEAMTVFSYTWLQALTEVPDDSVAIEYPISIANGGTGATTAAQALTNLGAASATALDALTATVAGKANASHSHSDYATVTALNALEDEVDGKANTNHTHNYAASSHTHSIANITNLQTTLDGKAASSHTHSNYATVANLDALEDVVDGKADASHTHDYAASNHTHSNYVATTDFDALSDEVDGKADSNHSHSNYALTTHNHDGVYATASHTHNYAAASHGHSVATTAADGFMSAADKTKLSGIATGAEVNQNAFSNVTVGSTTIAADGKTDTLTLVAGANVTLTPDATNDKVTIAATDTVYTHPTYTARTGVPVANQTPGFGGTFNITQPVSDGSGHVTAMNSRTVTIPNTAATTSVAGLMSADDKTKLNGIATGANAYTHPTTAGNKHIPAGGSSGQILRWSADGTAVWGNDNNTTYSNATQSAAGLMSATDKAKLDGIASGANNYTYTLPAAGSSLGGVKTGGDVTISSGTITVNDDSHNHVISNVDGLQAALDGKSATSHNHNSSYISKDLQFTGDNGGVMLSYLKDDGKNILTEFASYPIGFYTVYSQSGTAGNPKTTEAWRFMVHKTGTNTGWVQGYGSIGSVYTNYLDGSSGWRGWKCIWDNDPNPLWSGQYYMSSPNSTPQTVTPSKKLSECRTGWLLLWSDYDAGSGSNDSDFVTTVIPKNDPSGNKWGGKSFLCDIPRYVGSNAEDVDTERRIIKPIYVHDDCIKGSYQNDKDERNDVVLRAVYEI